MLKPAYNFSGLSISQLMKTDVEKYYRTRDSISDLVHSFSISGIKTDLQSLLAGGSGEDEMKRAQLFNQIRDNRGLMLLDHELEEFFQFNTPLTGLAELQTQAKEQMAAPAHIPLVKMFGITPGGLNASSEGEIKVFYDHIAAQQENVLRDPLEKILKIIQLDCYGEIDESISFEFLPLMELTELEEAQLRKSDGDLAIELINAGVISPEEERERLTASPNSGYSNIDVDNVPKPLDFEENNNIAQDSEHWITLENGEHVLVDGDGQVLSGAGGNLNYKYLPNIKSKSNNKDKTSNSLTNAETESTLLPEVNQSTEGKQMKYDTLKIYPNESEKGSTGTIRAYFKSEKDSKQQTINLAVLKDGNWKASINYGGSKPVSITGKSESYELAKNDAVEGAKELAEKYLKGYLQYDLRNDQKAEYFKSSFVYSSGGELPK
jgi:hypothetical protein